MKAKIKTDNDKCLTGKYKKNQTATEICGSKLTPHPDITLKRFFCKNRRCANYYKCSCGKEFGKHYPLIENILL
jgi:hypothetical protein